MLPWLALLGCLTPVAKLLPVCFALPSWGELEKRLPSAKKVEPLVVDTAYEKKRPKLTGLTLFRERNGWCPYSERVWLAMEAKGLDYETILIDNMGSRPSWYSGQTPQVRWANGNTQGESIDIIKALDREFPDTPQLWPNAEVTELVTAFKRIFPSGTRPSSRAAFLFKGWGGSPVPLAEFEAALDGADELLGRFDDGPFFHGAELTAADCAWAPFLERYAAQLPCLHAGLNPRDASRWPRLATWYDAMEQRVPAYHARVQGDKVSWRRVLAQAGFGNGGVAPTLLPEEPEKADLDDADVQGPWEEYAAGRPHVAGTPRQEAAARVVRNRLALDKDAVKQGAVTQAEASDALRGYAALLLDGVEGAEDVPASVKAIAAYMDERMCVPRDMGVAPARVIRALAAQLCA